MALSNAAAHPDLVRAWLSTAQQALVMGQVEQAEQVLEHLGQLLIPLDQQSPPHSPTTLSYALGLDCGIKRQDQPNEDFPFAHQWQVVQASGQARSCGLFIVADGMGGYAHGQEASCLLVQTMVDHIVPKTCQAAFTGSPAQIQAVLVESIQRGNQVIYQRNRARQQVMGTTVTALLLIGQHAVIANVGDSRTYVLRAGQALRQVTRDHSVVADLLQRGEITQEQALSHPWRNHLTRCIGRKETVLVDTFELHLSHQDRLLLCSDGVSGMLDTSALHALLAKEGFTAHQRVEHVIAKALGAGGSDNISVVVIEVQLDVSLFETMLGTWQDKKSRIARRQYALVV